MSEQPTLADVRRTNLATARAAKIVKKAAIEQKVDRLEAAVTRLIEALGEMLGEMTMRLANPPVVMLRQSMPQYVNGAGPLLAGGASFDPIEQREADDVFRAFGDPVAEIEEPPANLMAEMEMASELAEMRAEIEEPPPPPDEFEVWDRRLTLFRGNRMWLGDWGPRPGQDGCRAPEELLRGRR